MRRFSVLLFICCLSTLISCGTRSVPEAYGIYAQSQKGLTRLEGQKITLKGNILKQIGGIEGPSGFECQRLKAFVVYEKGVSVDAIKVARLEFSGKAELPAGPFGTIAADMRIWVPVAQVDFVVKPVNGKTDMYFIEPQRALEKGFYALYFNSFDEWPSVTLAYDVVVGKAGDFPSYSAAREQDRKVFRGEAERLLAAVNRIFNGKDYASLTEVYRPNGRVLAGEEFQKLADGMRTLQATAGEIVSSQIVAVEVSENADSGRIELQTSYERGGVQREQMRIQKFGERFFITSLK
jgi:hypothetical protein